MSKTLVTVVIALGLAGGLVRAGQSSFEKQRNQMQSEWDTQQKSQGLTDRSKLYGAYPTPELLLDPKPVVVQPGGGGSFTMRGKFASGTNFLAENEGVALTGALSGGAYVGKLVADPNMFPAFIRVWAFTPVSGASNAGPVAFVNSVLAFNLQAPNGWTIRMTPTAKAFTVSASDATLPYRVEFIRANEPKPFEVRQSNLRLTVNSIGEPLSFAMGEQAGSAQAELEQIAAKLTDIDAYMKMPEAEQNRIMERMQVLQTQMINEMMAQMKIDPKILQQQQDDFGCSSIYITPVGAGKVTARVGCGRNIGQSGQLYTTGTATVVR